VAGRIPVSLIECCNKRRRERDVGSFLADDRSGQFLRGCSLFLIKKEELLSRKGGKEKQRDAPWGDLAVRVHQKRCNGDVQGHRHEDSTANPRDLSE